MVGGVLLDSPQSANFMCRFRKENFTPIHMTLSERLSQPTTRPWLNTSAGCGGCISGSDFVCPYCRKMVQVTVTPCCGKTPTSPSFPIFFLQPPFSANIPPRLPSYDANLYISSGLEELKRKIKQITHLLERSGWYYPNLDWQGARSLLKDAKPGAFLIRDSGARNLGSKTTFMFSLSVQTERGPTSVRLQYQQGYFRLDCDVSLEKHMPQFRCVVDLIQHYVCCGVGGAGGAGTVWVDRDGCPHSPVLLSAPLRHAPPSLMHAARTAIHKALDRNPLPKLHSAPKHKRLPLPASLVQYLGEYPYWI